MLVVLSDLPLFDDVKKGESYLLRETLFDVLDIFCVLDLYFVFCVFGHVFCVDIYLFMLFMLCGHMTCMNMYLSFMSCINMCFHFSL